MLNNNLSHIFPGKPKGQFKHNVLFKHTIDYETIDYLATCLNNRMKEMEKINQNTIIIGLSGGIDSVISCLLAKKSKVPAKAVIVEVDDENNLTSDTKSAVKLVKKIGIDFEITNAARLYTYHLGLFKNNSAVARIHLRSRIINTVIFQYADTAEAVVLDTTDKSERILKLHEESFRGHIAPIVDLYKTELYDMADLLGFKELRKSLSGCKELDNLDAFGMEWHDIDAILHLICDKNEKVGDVINKYNIDARWMEKLLKRINTQSLRTIPYEIKLDKQA